MKKPLASKALREKIRPWILQSGLIIDPDKMSIDPKHEFCAVMECGLKTKEFSILCRTHHAMHTLSVDLLI